MSIGVIEGDYLQNIADAIREKNASDETYYPEEMGDAIREIDLDTTEELEIYEEGEYYPPEGVIGFSEVYVEIEEDYVDEDGNPVTDSVTITENGTYRASDYDLTGYTSVTVNVPKAKVSGKKSGDSNEYSVKRDNNGYLVETKIPSYIKIITPPSKTSYEDNELIKKDGMVVKAYYGDGSEWGTVPLGEITLDPDRASLSCSGESGEIYTDGDGVNCEVARYTYVVNSKFSGWVYTKILGTNSHGYPSSIGGGDGSATLLLTRYNGLIYVKRIQGENNREDLMSYYFGHDTTGDHDGWFHAGGTSGRTSDTRFTVLAWQDYFANANIPISTKDPNQAGELHPAGAEITVKWNRPEDDEELTDTFDITVH